MVLWRMDKMSFWAFQYFILEKAWNDTFAYLQSNMSVVFLILFAQIIGFAVHFHILKKNRLKEEVKKEVQDQGKIFIYYTIVPWSFIFIFIFLVNLFREPYLNYGLEEDVIRSQNISICALKEDIKKRPEKTKIEYQVINSTTSETPEEVQIRKEKVKKLQEIIDLSGPLTDDFVMGQKPVSVLSTEAFNWFTASWLSLRNNLGNDKAIEFLQVQAKSNYGWPSVPKGEENDFYLIQSRLIFIGNLKDELEKCP